MIKEKTDKLKEKGLSVDYIIRIGFPRTKYLPWLELNIPI